MAKPRWLTLDLLILLLGIALRVYRLTAGDLWHDEAFTALVSQLPVDQFIAATLGDVHPPTWYLITRPFIARLGPTVLAVRLPACLFSIASLICFWRLADGNRYHARRDVALAALALYAVSPFQIYYAQEARMYAALSLCAVLALWGVVERRAWLALAGGVAACYLHNLGLLLLGASVIAVSLQNLDRLKPQLVAVALALPAIAWAGYQGMQLAGTDYWIMDKGVGGWLYAAHFSQYVGGGLVAPELSWHAAAVTLALSLFGLVYAFRRVEWPEIALAWLPGLAALGFSVLVKPVLLNRTLIIGAPALCWLAGGLFTTRRRQIVLALALLPILVSSYQSHWFSGRRGNVEPMVQAVAREDPALLVSSSYGSWVVMSWAMPDREQAVWDGAMVGANGTLSQATIDGLEIPVVDLADTPRPLGIIYADHAMISNYERETMEGAMAEMGAELAHTLVYDKFQRIELWMVR